MTTFVSTIIEYKWIILLSCEISAWLFLGAMMIFRYFQPNKPLFWLSTTFSVFLGYVPHFAIPIMMAFSEQRFSVLFENKSDLLFVMFILTLLLFGLSFGKRYVVMLDQYMFNWWKKRQL